MRKKKSRDYNMDMYASGRVRALETTLLTPERIQRLIESNVQEGYRILAECGYDLSACDTNAKGSEGIYAVSKLLNSERERLYSLAESISLNPDLVGFFRANIDCHNIKTVVKSDYLGQNAENLMLYGGNFSKKLVEDTLKSKNYQPLGSVWAAAVENARDILSRTGDGQLSDFELDIAMIDVCCDYAEKSDSEFLVKYARFTADKINLKSAVRLMRIKDGERLAEYALSEKGHVAKKDVVSAMSASDLTGAYRNTPLSEAAEAGTNALKGAGALSDFELELAKADKAFFEDVKYIGFGPEILVAYLNAREREYTTVRTILAGKMTGVPADVIRKRLGMK